MIFTRLRGVTAYRLHQLFTDYLDADDRIEVFDPGSLLPKNQDSWK